MTTVSLDSRRGGGTAERTRKLARHLSERGVDCRIATIEDGDIAKELRARGMAVYVSGFIRAVFTLPFISPSKLSRAVADCDVVHILGYWNLLSIATAMQARMHGIPYTLSPAGEFAALDTPRLSVKIFHWLLGRKMIRHAAALIAITPLEKQQIHDRFGVNLARIHVLPNGVDGVAVSHSGAASPGRDILFVGRLAPIKGPDLLLEAFSRIASRFPDVNLVIAGPDFGLADDLKRAAAAPALQGRVQFRGFVDEAARTELLADALFLVVPSRSEAMSLVAVEAGVAGKAVLLTDKCGLDEVAALNAGVVCPATVTGLEAALVEMLTCGDLREKGAVWRGHVLRHYSWSKICDDYTELSVRLK